MDDAEGLSFSPLPPAAPATACQLRVAVLACGALKVTLTARAYARLGKPSRIAVESAKAQSGVGYLRLQVCADGDAGWPVRERTPSGGHRHSRAAAPYASVNIHTHPFDPGVTHRAVPVAATWIDDATVVIALPDWAGMRAALAAPEGDA